MLRVIPPIRTVEAVACSGGPDSMSVLSFIRNSKPNIKVLFFDHGTDSSQLAKEFLTNYCSAQELDLVIGKVSESKPKKDSWEEFWRNQRYKFLWSTGLTTATGHNLNDVAETYLFGAIHGQPKLIPYQNRNVIRPFLPTSKEEMLNWCRKFSVPYVEDESNSNLRFNRNRIRHQILPEVLKVNPGFLSVIKKKLMSSQEVLQTFSPLGPHFRQPNRKA